MMNNTNRIDKIFKRRVKERFFNAGFTDLEYELAESGFVLTKKEPEGSFITI